MHADIDTIARALDDAKLLVERRGALPNTIAGITDDSRSVRPGFLFVAVRGTERDGHDYLDAAAKAGAAASPTQTAALTRTHMIDGDEIAVAMFVQLPYEGAANKSGRTSNYPHSQTK